ncbi:MAG: BglII/BstYI family type II restriction endonuclease [Dehalococcoidia bacterium]
MRIAAQYSHLNGLEHLLIQKPQLWEEVRSVISEVDADSFLTKIPTEGAKRGKRFYSLVAINEEFSNTFITRHWEAKPAPHLIAEDIRLMQVSTFSSPDEQRVHIQATGQRTISSYTITDFIKDRVAVEVHFVSDNSPAIELFARPLASFVGDFIDVGIEIMPTKELQEEMSSGVPYYEGELYNLIREGRGVPAVPLVLVGIAP